MLLFASLLFLSLSLYACCAQGRQKVYIVKNIAHISHLSPARIESWLRYVWLLSFLCTSRTHVYSNALNIPLSRFWLSQLYFFVLYVCVIIDKTTNVRPLSNLFPQNANKKYFFFVYKFNTQKQQEKRNNIKKITTK